ncbi:MAG TPA: lipopolysaccharide heptosyltransferase II [Desulfurobacteriaceae bacterium]|nr:lipopolysaccharide heptosyltransferase II [Desulfurobacteriaceae bacterium]
MKLMIELPTWLGDAVMASGAVNKLIKYLKPKEVILFGSPVATSLYPNFKIIIDDRKNRLRQFFKLPKVDKFVSFRNSLYSKLLAFKYKGVAFNIKEKNLHMVEKYNLFVNKILKKDLPLYPPQLPFKRKVFKRPTFGINPGAAYGSAKRWYPEEFAKVANYLGKYGDIIIFGGPGEEKLAKEIEDNLTIKNYKNLCGKLTIKELCEHIGGLKGFVTNDSGPMHIAAAYNVPTIAIFGPTDYRETSPFSKNYKIITKNLKCSPCKKRVCPLKHHKCMKLIKAQDVIKVIKESNIFWT